jgi:outer membrane protein assembly factor BamB
VRWWLGITVIVLLLLSLGWVRAQEDWAFQKKNLTSIQLILVACCLLAIWWTFLSRAPKRLRLSVTFGAVGLAVLCALLFRIRGMTGDMQPIIEFRFARHTPLATPATNTVAALKPFTAATNASFPQFLGPNRDGVLPGPKLDTNWIAHPPELLWRQKLGAAWSGFAIVGNAAVTQEQRDELECIAAYDLTTGQQLWLHADKARYHTTIAGEGPRATPTILSNRVYSFGGTGLLNCLDLDTGKQLWQRDAVKESVARVSTWGCAGSPLIVNNLVLVHGGEDGRSSLLAFNLANGKLAWSSGLGNPSYTSLSFATFADAPQVLAFNDRSITSHNPTNGALLWQRPWGNGNVVCSSPVIVSTNRALFSSGYGYGAELLEISRTDSGKLSATQLWKSIRMKSKFAHLFARDGFLYGLDDGVFACLDLKDGSLRWKEGRYGHGQGLVIGDYYLLMSEPGELILLRPTPDAPNELARFKVFDSKTWNPPALSGDLLLVRNDREAACIRLKIAR